MSNFIRIDNSDDPGQTTLLNLDWVAKIELSHGDHLSNKHDVHVKCIADDAFILATLHFQDLDAAHHWVFENLGIRL